MLRIFHKEPGARRQAGRQAHEAAHVFMHGVLLQEKMLRIFHKEPGLGDKLAGRRNWCEIWEASSSISARNQPLPEYQVAAQGSLVFTLRLEVTTVKKRVEKSP